jgi:lysophospholipase L1-like esterase
VASEFLLGRRMIPRLKPDVVVMFTAINEQLAASIVRDLDGKNFDQLLRDQQWGIVPFHLDQARFLKRESVLVRFFDYKFKKLFERKLTEDYRGPAAKPQPTHPWVFANFEHTLRAYIDFLRANGVGRIVFTRWGDSGDANWFMIESRQLRDRGVEIAREMGVEIFDFSTVAAAHPQRKSLFIESGIHLTAAGADLFAEKLAAFLMAPAEVKPPSSPSKPAVGLAVPVAVPAAAP